MYGWKVEIENDQKSSLELIDFFGFVFLQKSFSGVFPVRVNAMYN